MFTQPDLYIGTTNGHHKISISGVVFYVEENGHNLLMDHLKLIHSNTTLRKAQDGYNQAGERVAELLLETLAGGKEIVTREEIRTVINKTKNLR